MKLISIILYLLIINKINLKLKLLFLIYYFFTLIDWVIPTGVFLFFKQEILKSKHSKHSNFHYCRDRAKRGRRLLP